MELLGSLESTQEASNNNSNNKFTFISRKFRVNKIKCASQTNTIQINLNKLRIPTGGRLTSCYLQVVEELSSGPPKTNPSSGREEDLNPGPPDYKSSTLPLGHARLPIKLNQEHQNRACR